MCTRVLVFAQAQITRQPLGTEDWGPPSEPLGTPGDFRSEDGSGCHVEKGLQVKKVVGDVPQEAALGILVRVDTA